MHRTSDDYFGKSKLSPVRHFQQDRHCDEQVKPNEFSSESRVVGISDHPEELPNHDANGNDAKQHRNPTCEHRESNPSSHEDQRNEDRVPPEPASVLGSQTRTLQDELPKLRKGLGFFRNPKCVQRPIRHEATCHCPAFLQWQRFVQTAA